MMEGCLLCLEINKVFCLTENSSQWEELHIQSIIEKHFWSMQKVEISSWLCNTCWKELYDFHKFYIRIEEAHMNFGKLIKPINENGTQLEEPMYSLSEHSVKQEQDNGLDEDDMPLSQICIKDTKEKDPLNKSKRKKTSEDKKTKRESNKKLKTSEISQNVISNTGEIFKIQEYIDSSHNIEKEDTSLNTFNVNKSNVVSNYHFDDESLESLKIQTYETDDKDKFIAENFKIACVLCQIPLENFYLLRKHFAIEHRHIKQGYVICCNKKIFQRVNLFDHLNHHLDPNYFKCQQCNKVFKDRICLNGHMILHKGNRKKKFTCDVCHKSFSLASILKYHKMVHLPQEEKQFPCSECGKRYTTQSTLNAHKKSHSSYISHICEQCGLSFRRKGRLISHIKHDHHNEPKIPQQCEICNNWYSGKYTLAQHIKYIHTNTDVEHRCTTCGHVSTTSKGLRTHILFNHDKNKYKHKCSVCGKEFKRLQNMREHMATHTGEALYKCEFCGTTFKCKSNLYHHRNRLHKAEKEEAAKNQNTKNNLNV